jgi:hypothetical protein
VIGGDDSEASVDGAYFGGYVKPANLKENRRDRRLWRNQSGKRKVVAVIRKHDGETLPGVFKTEGSAIAWIKARVAKGTTLNADEAGSWDALQDKFAIKRINHQEAYSFDGACTNWAESYFARLRRAEAGHHHHIAGPYLLRFAQKAAWREDNRRVTNGEQVHRVAGLALRGKPSPDFTGYWQRHVKTA